MLALGNSPFFLAFIDTIKKITLINEARIYFFTQLKALTTPFMTVVAYKEVNNEVQEMISGRLLIFIIMIY